MKGNGKVNLDAEQSILVHVYIYNVIICIYIYIMYIYISFESNVAHPAQRGSKVCNIATVTGFHGWFDNTLCLHSSLPRNVMHHYIPNTCVMCLNI